MASQVPMSFIPNLQAFQASQMFPQNPQTQLIPQSVPTKEAPSGNKGHAKTTFSVKCVHILCGCLQNMLSNREGGGGMICLFYFVFVFLVPHHHFTYFRNEWTSKDKGHYWSPNEKTVQSEECIELTLLKPIYILKVISLTAQAKLT